MINTILEKTEKLLTYYGNGCGVEIWADGCSVAEIYQDQITFKHYIEMGRRYKLDYETLAKILIKANRIEFRIIEF